MNSSISALEEKNRPVPRVLPPDTQQVCIDLPGEEVRCTVYKPKLEIMLRKHRDVIFDIRGFKGMQYTVEAYEDDFYNARDKKIVLSARYQKVSFKDGERLHLWVGRDFKGPLVLKANGKVLGRYRPADMDRQRYDSDPRTKPAPMLIMLANEPVPAPPWQSIHAAAKPWDEPETPALQYSQPRTAGQTMHIVEVKPEVGVTPDEVADFFKKGGEGTAIDADKLLTRNWLWAQIVGATAYVGDNLPWVRDLWAQKFYLSKVGGKAYIIFKGSPGLRKFLTGTRYLTDTPKVVAISAGAGTISGVHKAGWEAVKGSVKGAAKFALILTIALDFAEWLEDYEQRDPLTGKPKRDFYDLGAKIFTDVAWAVVGAAIGTVIAAGVVFIAGVVIGATIVGGVAVVIAIGAAVAAGYLLAWLDAQVGITPAIAAAAREAAGFLDNKLPRDYVSYEQSINNMMLGGAP